MAIFRQQSEAAYWDMDILLVEDDEGTQKMIVAVLKHPACHEANQ